MLAMDWCLEGPCIMVKISTEFCGDVQYFLTPCNPKR
jgi:hypothetical protein